MSVETMALGEVTVGLIKTEGADIALEYEFRRNADKGELQSFLQRLATNGGDMLSAIIDTATSADSERVKD